MTEPAYTMPMRLFDPANTRDISPDAIGPDGRLRILPASYWETTTVAERAVFGNRHGLYVFPTTELVDYLRELIGARSAIEIGSGSGVLADALGIPGTDSYQQEHPHYRAIYEAAGQRPAPYGPNVERLNAIAAVGRYAPQVVIGCWVTHLYNPDRHDAGGNEAGVNEPRLLKMTDTYIHVGNEDVHKGKAIWPLPHTIEYPPFVYSRAFNGTRDFVAVWNRETA